VHFDLRDDNVILADDGGSVDGPTRRSRRAV
jgi:hypothetical protein